jgi:hypothetical protein
VKSPARALPFVLAAALAVPLAVAPPAAAADTILHVGPDREYTTIAAAAEAAPDNSIIEIDAGDYPGDVAQFTQTNLTIRAVGGEVTIAAEGNYVDEMGIFKLDGEGTFLIQGITFEGARVPGGNGAGVRVVHGDLTIENCKFFDNEYGVMSSNFEEVSVRIHNSEFGYSGGEGEHGWTHLIYIGHIGYFEITGSYLHHAYIGHLLKTRARVGYIANNRLADGYDDLALASYAIDIPDGGHYVIVGNQFQKSPQADNPNFISFGVEGPDYWYGVDGGLSELYLAHNTFVSALDGSPGMFNANWAYTDTLVAYDNVIQDDIAIPEADGAVNPAAAFSADHGNVQVTAETIQEDFSLTEAAIDKLAEATVGDLDQYLPASLSGLGLHLDLTGQYTHPTSVTPYAGPAVVPGAVQPDEAPSVASLLRQILIWLQDIIARLLALLEI